MTNTPVALNPKIEIVVRSHNDDEARRLEAEVVAHVFLGEQELARAMTAHVLQRMQHG